MHSGELERLLEGAEETDRLEFKGPMTWEKKSLVRDILAMSNVQDGGKIVIGIEDKTLKRVGLTDEQIKSFDSDLIKDQIAPYADPAVRLRVHKIADSAGLRFVVIDVQEFEEIPIICRKDCTDVKKGDLYFRSPSQKPQSARVSEASDLRNILDRATVKRMKTLRDMGLTVNKLGSMQDFLDDELGGL